MGVLTPAAVHGLAEALWNSAEWPNLDEDDPRAIEIEVLSHLEILNYQLITRDDIPAMLTFLDTRIGAEQQGWMVWKQYWDMVDMDNRAAALKDDPFYII